MTFESIQSLRKHLSIKEHSPGLLKLKIDLAVLSDPNLGGLPRFDEPPPGVNRVKVSLFSRTLVLDYDHSMLPPELVEEMVCTRDDDRFQDIVHALEERMGIGQA
jgi:hypothetical protein